MSPTLLVIIISCFIRILLPYKVQLWYFYKSESFAKYLMFLLCCCFSFILLKFDVSCVRSFCFYGIAWKLIVKFKIIGEVFFRRPWDGLTVFWYFRWDLSDFSGCQNSTVLFHLVADERPEETRRFSVLFIDWEA